MTAKEIKCSLHHIIFILFLINLTSIQAGLTIGSVSSTSTCYDALSSSSGDDNLVDKQEFVTFVNLLSDDYFTYPQFDTETNQYANLPLSEFYQLPIELQTNFNKLACGGEFISCANAYLVTDGANEGEKPTEVQTIYLYEVCSNTEESIDAAKENLEAVEGLTLSPATVSPVGSPTIAPSAETGSGSSGAPSSSLDLTKAITYYTSFRYQISVSREITSEDVLDTSHQLNMDLVSGMNVWSTGVCAEWNNGTGSERRLRGSGRKLLVSTEVESSIVTNVTDVSECYMTYRWG